MWLWDAFSSFWIDPLSLRADPVSLRTDPRSHEGIVGCRHGASSLRLMGLSLSSQDAFRSLKDGF